MRIPGKRAALYLHTPYEEAGDLIQRAQAYCTEHGYHLSKQHIYQDTEQRQPALVWLKDAMNDLEFHLLLVPTLSHISTHMGHVLNFLQDAQECQIEVICLEPVPTNLSELSVFTSPLKPFD